MVKVFVLAALCFASVCASESGSEKQGAKKAAVVKAAVKDALVEKIFRDSGVADFVQAASAAKQGDRPAASNPYAGFVVGPGKRLLKDFSANAYVKGLKRQMTNRFNAVQLGELSGFYGNPFNAKILIIANTRAYAGNFLNAEPLDGGGELSSSKEVMAEKMGLIAKIVEAFRLSNLFHDQKEMLKAGIRRRRKLIAVLKQGKPADLTRRLRLDEQLLKNFDKRLAFYLAKAFRGVRPSELREAVRRYEKKTYRDAAQLLTNYHYYFLEKGREDAL